MFPSVQVSSLALRYCFLLWCRLSLYAKLVMRWDVVGSLGLACAHWILTCKQKESSLEVKSSDWLCIWSHLPYTLHQLVNGVLWVLLTWKVPISLKHKLVKCPYLWQDLHWYFFAGHLNPSTFLESSHLRTPFFACMSLFRIKLCFVWGNLIVHWYGMLVTQWSWLESFSFVFAWWEVCLLISHQIDLSHLGITLQLAWCAMLLPLMHPFSLPSCLTLLARNLSRLTLLSLMVLDTNSVIFQEKPKDVMNARCLKFLVGI